jgi:hypothetical protein
LTYSDEFDSDEELTLEDLKRGNPQLSMNTTLRGAMLNEAWRNAMIAQMPDIEPLYFKDGTPYGPPKRTHEELSAQARAQPRDDLGRFTEIPRGTAPIPREVLNGARKRDQAWPHGSAVKPRTTRSGKRVKRVRARTVAQTAYRGKKPLPRKKKHLRKKSLLGRVKSFFTRK